LRQEQRRTELGQVVRSASALIRVNHLEMHVVEAEHDGFFLLSMQEGMIRSFQSPGQQWCKVTIHHTKMVQCSKLTLLSNKHQFILILVGLPRCF
jgi:C4-type Zn-finger protein